jgi:hypothetical protein
VATGAGAAAVGVGAVPVGVGAVGAGAGVVAVSGSVLARCGLGHRDASRHTHEHRRRHNTRKFLHLKLQLVLPRDRNRQRNPTTLPMQLSVPALKTDMEEGPGWVKRVFWSCAHCFRSSPNTGHDAALQRLIISARGTPRRMPWDFKLSPSCNRIHKWVSAAS